MAKRHASHLPGVVERLRRNAWPNRLCIASGRFPAGGHKWGDCRVVTVGAAGGGLVCFGRRGLILPCGWMMCLTLPQRTTRQTPSRHSRAGGNPGASTACSGVSAHDRPAMLKPPTGHAVARSGFPPARERQVGEIYARRGLAPDGCYGLIYFETKLYLATANHPPRPTPLFPRRRESRGIYSV